MKKEATQADDLRRAGIRAQKAVQLAALLNDFTALDRIVFEGWAAMRFACSAFGEFVKTEQVEGGPLFHPLMNRLRVFSRIQGLPDPAEGLQPAEPIQ